jgi:hypothetical protein
VNVWNTCYVFEYHFGFLCLSFVADIRFANLPIILIDNYLLPQLLDVLSIEIIVVFFEASALPANRILVPFGLTLCSCCALDLVNNLLKKFLRQLGQCAITKFVTKTQRIGLRRHVC